MEETMQKIRSQSHQDSSEPVNDEDPTKKPSRTMYIENYPSDWEEEDKEDGSSGKMSTTELSPVIKLGTIPTTNFDATTRGTGRMLSFPNWVQVYF